LTGAASALSLKYMDLKEHGSGKPMIFMEAAVAFVFAYISFVAAEVFHWSGIVSSLTAAIFMSTYFRMNMSPEGAHVTGLMFRAAAVTSETLIFFMVGENVFLYDVDEYFHTNFFFFTLMLCLVGRVLNIFTLTGLTNLCKSKEWRIGLPSQVVMWNAGLRGAIAFALAISFPDDNKHRKVVINTTMFIILTTVFGHGAMTVPLLRLFKLQKEEDSPVASSPHPSPAQEDAEQRQRGLSHADSMSLDAAEPPPPTESVPGMPMDGGRGIESFEEIMTSPRGPSDITASRQVQKERTRRLWACWTGFDDKWIRPTLLKPEVLERRRLKRLNASPSARLQANPEAARTAGLQEPGPTRADNITPDKSRVDDIGLEYKETEPTTMSDDAVLGCVLGDNDVLVDVPLTTPKAAKGRISPTPLSPPSPNVIARQTLSEDVERTPSNIANI